jgi:hypothetical protein
LRYNETEVPAIRREWKVGKRDREPELEDFNEEKLAKRMRSQLHAGSLPTRTSRRVSVAERGQRLLAQKLKLKAKELRVSAALQETRKNDKGE